MYKQSSFIIALLFSSSEAIQFDGPVEFDYKPKPTPLGKQGYNPWVSKFSNDMLDLQAFSHSSKTYPPPVFDEPQRIQSKKNGKISKVKSLAQQKDVSDKKIKYDVYHFVNENVNSVNEEDKPSVPYQGNGKLAHKNSFAQQYDQDEDISDKKINYDVWHFVNDNVVTINEVDRNKESTPYAHNGISNQWPSRAEKTRKEIPSAAIGDRRIDPEVHGFVSDLVPFTYSSAQKTRKEIPSAAIGDRRIDPEVHGFVSDLVPFTYSRAEKARNDQPFQVVGESKIDPEVHGFVSEVVPLSHSGYNRSQKSLATKSKKGRTSWGEPRGWHGGYPDTIGPYNIDPWVYRYSGENVPPQAYEHYRVYRNPEISYADRRRQPFQTVNDQDISDKKINYDVWHFVNENVVTINEADRNKESIPYAYNGINNQWPSRAQQTSYYPGEPYSVMREQTINAGASEFVNNAWPIVQSEYNRNGRQSWNSNYNYPRAPRSYNTRFSQRNHRPYDPFAVVGPKGYDPKVSGIVNDAVFEFESNYNRRGPQSYNTRFSQKRHPYYEPFTTVREYNVDPRVYGFVNYAWPNLFSDYNRRGPQSWNTNDYPKGSYSARHAKKFRHGRHPTRRSHVHRHARHYPRKFYQSFSQDQDISNDEVNPKVYHFVNNVVEPQSSFRKTPKEVQDQIQTQQESHKTVKPQEQKVAIQPKKFQKKELKQKIAKIQKTEKARKIKKQMKVRNDKTKDEIAKKLKNTMKN